MTFVHIFIVLQMSALSESPKCLQSSLIPKLHEINVFQCFSSEPWRPRVSWGLCLMGSPWWLHSTSPLPVSWEKPSSDSLKTSDTRSVRHTRGGKPLGCPTSWGASPCHKMWRISFLSMRDLIFFWVKFRILTCFLAQTPEHTWYGCFLSQATGSGCFE